MNKIKNIILLLLVGGVMLFPGCKGGGDDPGPNGGSDEKSRVSGLMKSGTWKLKSLAVDGVDQSSSFPNMTLTFSDATYASTNGKDVWPASGTWAFTSDAATAFTRNDNTQVSIDAISATDMTLSLNWATTKLGPGRVQGIQGKNVFKFGK
jgi:hypothetical protein